MNTIKGQKLISIHAVAGETYAIQYEAPHTLNIINQTDDVISVSDKQVIRDDGTAADCIMLAEGAFINGLKLSGSTAYITANGSGDIAIVRSA
ncbi:MAG: hypothetical protein ACI38A_09150 [Candidatus Ornithomonoglobus sp.]